MSAFRVLDTKTGRYVNGFRDMEQEVIDHPATWDGLVYCDLCGWLIDDEGYLYLQDSCGNYAAAPERYKVIYSQSWLKGRIDDGYRG